MINILYKSCGNSTRLPRSISFHLPTVCSLLSIWPVSILVHRSCSKMDEI